MRKDTPKTLPWSGGGPPELAPALSGGRKRGNTKKQKLCLTAAPESRPFRAWTAAGPGQRVSDSIVFAGAFPVVFDSGAFCLVVAPLCFLSAGDFGFLPFCGYDERRCKEIFQTDPCQFPVPGQAAGFFGEDHDLSGGELCKQPFPYIIGNRS